MSEFDIALGVAFNLAEYLIKIAHKEPVGWSWETTKHSSIRNLCGYAHGNAGIAHAFLELYSLTNNNYYLYPFEQALLYERQFYNESRMNWPDFRYNELFEYSSYNRINELKEALRNKSLIPYELRYMNAWCHGAPGIGLSRLRAYEILQNDLYRQESINACNGTAQFLGHDFINYSLCHGLGGNCETLIIGSNLLGREDYLNIAHEVALKGIDQFGSKNIPWTCGTVGNRPDPSFMVGEAGIGYFLLRLYDHSIPSVLCLTAKRVDKIVNNDGKNYKQLQANYVNEYYDNTFKLINSIEPGTSHLTGQLGFTVGE